MHRKLATGFVVGDLIAILSLLLVVSTTAWLQAKPLAWPSFQTKIPVALQAATTPTVGAAAATPAFITVNTRTTVTMTVQLTDSRLLPNGVNLLRLNGTGPSTILGVMHDDGLNGDATANDEIFSLNVNLNEPTTGQVQLQVSAAFKGLLKRVTSGITFVDVWNAYNDITAGSRISYPPGWVASTSTTVDNEEYFSPASSPPNSDEEYITDIVVDTIPNPTRLDLSSYYSTQAEVNYYANSDSALAFTTTSGLPAVNFSNVAGMIPTDIIAVNTGNAIIEIDDVGQQHGSDGIMNAMANSIR